MQLAICLLLGAAASVEDVWRRQISNVTVVAGVAAGLAIQIHRLGWVHGSLGWLAGVAAGFAIFLAFYLAGGMGGGDIKLMAAFGACLGASQILYAAFFTAIVGALMAGGYLLWSRLFRPGRPAESIPYAPAIFAGALLSFAAGR